MEYITERYNDKSHIEAMDYLDSIRVSEANKYSMLSISSKEVAKHVIGLVCLEKSSNTPIGYNAVTREYENGVLEIGGLFIHPNHRGLGITRLIKKNLYEEIVNQYDPETRLLIFANNNSKQLNMSYGFKEVEDYSTIPPDALRICLDSCNGNKILT